jgi:hypothetical protein
MLVDIMSPYNTLSVNVKAVKLFGLPCAAYWSVLVDIYPRVIKKDLDGLLKSGFFTVDRGYVTSRCGLSTEEQLTYDQALARVGVLATCPNNPDMLAISMQDMFTILAEDDAAVLKDISKKAKSKSTDKAAGKKAGVISTLSNYASTLTHVPEVQEAFKMWVIALVEGKKPISKPVVQLFYETMSNFTNNPELQVNILKSATASGYSNAEWVINSIKKSSAATPTYINATQKQFTGIDTTETF